MNTFRITDAISCNTGSLLQNILTFLLFTCTPFYSSLFTAVLTFYQKFMVDHTFYASRIKILHNFHTMHTNKKDSLKAAALSISRKYERDIFHNFASRRKYFLIGDKYGRNT